MDKKDIMIQAFKYLDKDLLYGTISGRVIKDYLLEHADTIIKDNMDPEFAAATIKVSMHDKETEEPLYVSASERVNEPLGAVLDVTEEDKSNYIESFISSAPYTGDIVYAEGYIFNVADEIRKLKSSMNDDYTINFNGVNKTIKQVYARLLSNEYIPASKVDKYEVILYGVRELRQAYPDYDEISNLKIDGKTFMETIKTLPDKMDDTFMVGEENVVDYMSGIFKKYAEARYNSFNSKPTNVETIKIERNKENQMEATSEYLFMGDDEIESITSSQPESDIDRLRNKLLDIVKGIEAAQTIDTLEEYEAIITDTWDEVKNKYPNDESLKRLYETIVTSYDSKQKQIVTYQQNVDEAEFLLRDELRKIKNELEEVRTDFIHTYENPEKKLEEIEYEFSIFKRKAEDMGVKMHHEIEEVERLKRSVRMKIEYSMDNISHISRRKKQELDDIMTQAYAEFRKLSYTEDYTEKAAIQVRITKLSNDLSRKLEDVYKEGYITENDYEDYLADMNRKLSSYDMDTIRRRY